MKRNIQILIIVLLVGAYACTLQTDGNKPSGKLIEKAVDALVQPYIDSSIIAGLSIGVARNDTLLFLKSYGYADLAFDVPLPVSASFEIGSVTKQFTSTAIMQLVDKGLIDLQDPLNDYLLFETHGRTVTIEQLMNHTSGIKGYTEMSAFENLSVQDFPRDTLIRLVEKEDFDFEPGEAMIYNNTAYFMLGLIIEEVTGQAYEAYLTENVFSPAGMNNSYYCSNSKIIRNQAYGYDTSDEGKLLKAAYLDHTWPYSAGSLCSTVEDLLKWNHIFHTTDIILNKGRYDELIAPSSLKDGTRLRYAKGLFVDTYKGTKIISHGGGINGFLSDSRYFPEHGLAIVTLVNTLGPVGPESISNAVADLLLPASEGDQQLEFNGDISLYPGNYNGSSRGGNLELKVESAGQELVIEIGENRDTLAYVGNNLWLWNGVRISFEIEINEVKTLHIDSGYGYYILEKDD